MHDGRRMDGELHSSSGDPAAQLTSRELECLRLVQEHLSSKEIAARLAISRHTVDQRIRHALRTLGAKRRTDAVRILGSGALTAAKPSQEPAPTPAAFRRARPSTLPLPTPRRPLNTLSARERVFWILAISIGATFSAGIMLAALESVERMVEG